MDDSQTNQEHVNGDARRDFSSSLQSLAETADQLRRTDERIIAQVQKHPLAAVGLAALAGYFVGRIFSRIG